MRILISGFEPIWGLKRSPSGELAKLWNEGGIIVPHGVEVTGIVLPQVFEESTKNLCTEAMRVKPDVILMYGATTKNDPLRIEKFAINCEKSVMGDNNRVPIKERSIIPGGPPAYESSLPIPLLIEKIQSKGLSVKTSYHAGTHVCNSLFYGVMHWIQTRNLNVIAGFVHIPFPNEFGVVEDELWDTASWPGIVNSSVALVEAISSLRGASGEY